MGCHCHDHEGHCDCHEHHHEQKVDSSFSRILLIGRCGLALVLGLLGRFLFSEANLLAWGVPGVGALLINLGIMLAAFFLVAYDVIGAMIHDIVKEHEFFGEETLMVLASIGAFSLRAFGPEANEFLEAVLVMLLYQVGEMLEDIASDQSRDAILSSIDVRHHRCQVENGSELIYKVPEQLNVGDICVYGAGMKILCDGRVLSGEGSVDESSLTGEALPVPVARGSAVHSLTLLKEGSIRVVVEKAYEDSTAAKMMELIEESSEKKSHVTRAIDRFSKIYTPIVMAIALLVAVLPPLFLGAGNGANWATWVYAALSFLVVACPCAIVISVPLAYFSGLGVAARNGILVKGASYFDALDKPRVIAFDKTGTLTKGQFAIVEKRIVDLSEEEFAEYLCAAESRSSHPLSKAILAGLKGEFAHQRITAYEERAGLGVSLTYKGKKILAGKRELLTGIDLPDVEESIDGTRVFLSVDGIYRGFLTLGDQTKENAKQTIEKLRLAGLKTVLLSGDKEANVSKTASALGIDQWHGGLTPEEKTLYIEKAKGDGAVLFVGDGINDAAALKIADVGIAMGQRGSDLALECADCLLVGDDLDKVNTLIGVARATRKRAFFNIGFALFVKFAIVALSFFGALTGAFALPLWVAAIGDTGVTLLCILFSVALAWRKKND